MTLLHLFRLRRTLKHISGVEKQLCRIADCLESYLTAQGIAVKIPETHEPAQVFYTDERLDRQKEVLEEVFEQMGGTPEQVEEYLREMKEQETA